MDKKFLNKVIKQVTSETRVDYKNKLLYPSFSPYTSFFPSHPLPTPIPIHLTSLLRPLHPSLSIHHYSFKNHCKDVYGLIGQEVEYVWGEYINRIKNKINKESV
jgi:hypothetical protein